MLCLLSCFNLTISLFYMAKIGLLLVFWIIYYILENSTVIEWFWLLPAQSKTLTMKAFMFTWNNLYSLVHLKNSFFTHMAQLLTWLHNSSASQQSCTNPAGPATAWPLVNMTQGQLIGTWLLAIWLVDSLWLIQGSQLHKYEERCFDYTATNQGHTSFVYQWQLVNQLGSSSHKSQAKCCVSSILF